MRTVAQYSFNGANKNTADAKQLFEKSCKAIEAWLADKGELDADKKTLHLEDGRIAECEIDRTTCDSGATAKWIVSEPSGASRFCTTLALANLGAEVALACNLSTGFTDATIAPRPFTARCPKVLRDILGIQPGWRVGESVIPCRAFKYSQAEQVDNLIELLLSPKRALPVVVISSYDGFPLHPDLAGLLSIDVCGLAIVVEINDEVAWEFTNRVGREWSCFNAGVRIYWPHLNLESNPRNHPLWTSERLMQRLTDTETASKRIRGVMRKRLFSISALAVEPPPLFERIEDGRAKKAFVERSALATTAEEYKALAEEYATGNDDLRHQLQQEREIIKQLREDLYRMQLANAWVDSEEDVAPVEDAPPASVKEAVDRARRDFAQQLTFGDDVSEGVDGLAPHAGPPDKILEYFRVLASMVEPRRSGGLGLSPVQWLVAVS